MNAVGNVPTSSVGGERASGPSTGPQKPVSPLSRLEEVVAGLNRDFEGAELTWQGTDLEVLMGWHLYDMLYNFAREVVRQRLVRAKLRFEVSEDASEEEVMATGNGFRVTRSRVPLWQTDDKVILLRFTSERRGGVWRLYDVQFDIIQIDEGEGDE